MADIIRNLRYLQFESHLSDEQRKLSYLRLNTHAAAVTACAQITYVMSLIRDARLIVSKMKSLAAESGENATFNVGIIGCGRIGLHVANSLLTFGEIQSDHLKISTRRPEQLGELKKLGVSCIFDNASVAKEVSLLILCCLPSQLQSVAADIRSSLRADTLVYSVVSATPISRLQQLLGTQNILRPEMTFNVPCSEPQTAETTATALLSSADGQQCCEKPTDIVSSLGHRETVEKTCPLSFTKQKSCVTTNEHFAAMAIFGLVNSLSRMQLSTQHKLSIINALVLGHTRHCRQENVFTADDFEIDSSVNKSYLTTASIDLVSLSKVDTAVDRKLNSEAVRRSFVDRYCDVFQQHINWVKKSGIGCLKQHLDIIND